MAAASKKQVDDDDDTILPTGWEDFQHPKKLTIPFSKHTGPTKIYLEVAPTLESFPGAHQDVEELFTQSREFIESLEYRETDKIGEAYHAAFLTAFQHNFESDVQHPRLPCDSLCVTQSLTGLSASLTAHSRHQSFMTVDVR